MAAIRRYTIQQAREGIYTTFWTAWDDPTLGWRSIDFGDMLDIVGGDVPIVFWENVQEEDAPEVDKPHVRVFVRHATSEHDSFGQDGEGDFEARGNVIIQVFAPHDTAGLILLDQMCRVIARAFRGKTGAGDFCGIRFRRVRVNEIGPDDRWMQHNVLAQFEYEEDNT